MKGSSLSAPKKIQLALSNSAGQDINDSKDLACRQALHFLYNELANDTEAVTNFSNHVYPTDAASTL